MQNINFSNCAKFLGVTIDTNLSWSVHINNIVSKLSKGVGVISRLRHTLPTNLLIKIYYILIMPYLTYCCVIWGNSALTHLKKNIVIQKKCIRIITKSHFIAHTEPLYHQLNILCFTDIVYVQNAVFMYQFTNNLLSPDFKHLFMYHNYSTRQFNKLKIPLFRLTISQAHIHFIGVGIWNSLPTYLKTSKNITIFKLRIKRHISTYIETT